MRPGLQARPSDKKFFKSKIDFKAPLNSLRRQANALKHDNSLSDDSSIAQVQRSRMIQEIVELPTPSATDREVFVSKKAETDPTILSLPQTSLMEGYTNLSLIKESDDFYRATFKRGAKGKNTFATILQKNDG